jgi:hypothetical protein
VPSAPATRRSGTGLAEKTPTKSASPPPKCPCSPLALEASTLAIPSMPSTAIVTTTS